MRVCVLGSGSRGNSIYIESEGRAILIDQGFSFVELKKRLDCRGLNSAKIMAILISHEHEDHLRGAGVASRKMDVPVYGTLGTLKAKKLEIHPEIILRDGVTVRIGPFEIAPYAVSHDACEPVQFVITSGKKKVSIATDLGFVSSKVEACISGSDLLIVEANHDLKMLDMGKYPYHLKKRIKSSIGHLSNRNAAETIFNLAANGGCRKAVLAHISEENNSPEMAEKTVRDLFEIHDRNMPHFIIATQTQPTPVIEV